MKKKYIATLVAIMLLAGCGTPAPAAPSTTDEPDMEAIIQQSVDEAVKEKLEQIEEEQKKKDEEIAKLKEQLEDLTAQSEAPPGGKLICPSREHLVPGPGIQPTSGSCVVFSGRGPPAARAGTAPAINTRTHQAASENQAGK